jgi:hypothetical protein
MLLLGKFLLLPPGSNRSCATASVSVAGIHFADAVVEQCTTDSVLGRTTNLTPRGRFLHEKVIFVQLVKEFGPFYISEFYKTLTACRHCSYSNHTNSVYSFTPEVQKPRTVQYTALHQRYRNHVQSSIQLYTGGTETMCSPIHSLTSEVQKPRAVQYTALHHRYRNHVQFNIQLYTIDTETMCSPVYSFTPDVQKPIYSFTPEVQKPHAVQYTTLHQRYRNHLQSNTQPYIRGTETMCSPL